MTNPISHRLDDLDANAPRAPLAALFLDRSAGSAGRKAFSLLVSVTLVALVTGFCWASRDWLSPQAACLIYLAVTVAAGALGSPSIPLPLAFLSLLTWNFFFTAPRFSLHIGSPDDRVLFAVFAVVAFTQYRLVARLRERERESRQAEARALLLVELRVALEHGRVDEALLRLGGALDATASLKPASDGNAVSDPSEYGRLNLWTKELEVAGRVVNAPLLSATARYGHLCLTFPGPVTPGADGERLLWDVAALLASRIERDALAASAERARETEISEKLGRTLLDHVTHEMKTPAAIILAALHELRPALRGDAPVSPESVCALEEAAWRVHLVTDELTARAGISAGLLHPEPELCEAGELVAELLPQLASEGQRPRLRVRDTTGGAYVNADPKLTGAILAHLVSNALRLSPRELPVDITISRTAGRVAITVRDRGPGLAEDSVEACFVRYRSGDKPGVLGLGLAIARDFTGMLGGELLAHNAPDGGAAFSLNLPEVPAPLLDASGKS